ncbi:MAG: SLC26A/SulP transporter family protein [Proteobacteria bacterium]|nr:SLC26A/SulP transporter family protein [Pseudomonadota bacterium]
MIKRRRLSGRLTGDILGGLTAMLVALPSAIAFGIIIYSPLGSQYAGKAVVAGMIGAVALGLIAPLFGGTPRLITAPCAPAAAVLSVFVGQLVKSGDIPLEAIPFYVALVALLAGIIQFLAGSFGGGKFIKYIPYPVVAGYLSGVGILIFLGQLPKFLGLPKGINILQGVLQPVVWNGTSIFIGFVTIAAMLLAPRFLKHIPAAIVALLSGICAYFAMAILNPALLRLIDNPLIIGPILSSGSGVFGAAVNQWTHFSAIDVKGFAMLLIPLLTLAVLLSIDTLKTCVILDVMTHSRHNSNKELMGQGLGNIASSLIGGIPGSGTMGPTLVNIASGGHTRLSGVFAGVFAGLVLLLLGKLMAWIPLAALAGVLIVIAVRMLDMQSLQLLKHRSTIFDFLVILAVVISAVSMSLIVAAGVGTALAIVLFLREQIRSSVIRRKLFGNQKFSKKRRITAELSILESHGKNTIICELQGQLFFGTTDQLLTELESHLAECSFVVLDMRRVQSLDFTAANMLKQIHNRVKKKKGYLVLSSIPLNLPTGQNVKKYLATLGFTETGMNLKIFPDLDSALEWIEDEIINTSSGGSKDALHILNLPEFEFFSGFPAAAIEKLSATMTEKSFQAGEKIFSMGDKSDKIYFIRKGAVKIGLPLTGGTTHHLLTLSRGDFFGEMSFLDKGTRSAEAVAVDEVMLYILSRNQFEKIVEAHPEIAGIFFERLAYTISQRLRLTNIEMMALEES